MSPRLGTSHVTRLAERVGEPTHPPSIVQRTPTWTGRMDALEIPTVRVRVTVPTRSPTVVVRGSSYTGQHLDPLEKPEYKRHTRRPRRS